MKKSKFSESQIVGILKEQEQGKAVADICREPGISQGTFYQWKAKYSGVDVAQLTRMKELELELTQYKKMYAELARQHYVLKDIVEKKL
jgi:putative transposase